MTYTNNINYHKIDYLDLFDDIPFKHVKSIVNQNKNVEDWVDFDFEVEIEDVECDRVAWCATKFTFELEIKTTYGSILPTQNKTFVVVKEYNGSSPMAMYIGENLYYEDEEEEEEDEEESDDDDDVVVGDSDEEGDIISVIDLVI